MEQALIDLLLGTPAITDLISDRLTPGVRTQGAALPALVMNVFPSERGYSHQGDDGLPSARVQLDAYAADYIGAHDLAAAVMARVSGFAGVVGDRRLTITEARQRTGFEYAPPARTCRRLIEFTVWSRAA